MIKHDLKESLKKTHKKIDGCNNLTNIDLSKFKGN